MILSGLSETEEAEFPFQYPIFTLTIYLINEESQTNKHAIYIG